MKLQVVHTEMYVPGNKTTTYDDIDSFVERYPITKNSYCSLSELPKAVGKSTTMRYDQYITLEVTLVDS